MDLIKKGCRKGSYSDGPRCHKATGDAHGSRAAPGVGGCALKWQGDSYNPFPCQLAYLKAKIPFGSVRTAVGNTLLHLPPWWCYLRLTPLRGTVRLPWLLFFPK